MSLIFDARANVTTYVEKKYINLANLPSIEKDLDVNDIVSILFLMVGDYTHAFYKVFELYRKAENDDSSVIAELIKIYSQDWENRLLESICVCNNRQVVKKLGLSFVDLEKKYLPNHRLYTVKLHPIAKCLYLLSESLNEEDTKKLLRLVKDDILCEYEPMLQDIEHLELHLLYWMEIGYISISSARKGNFKKLLKHLKIFEDLELIIIDLEQCNTDESKPNSNKMSNSSTLQEASSATYKPDIEDVKPKIRKINKGLCIIINVMRFEGSQYELRLGSGEDVNKLNNTFKGLGFHVYIHQNLKGNDIITTIKNITQQHGSDYDCIFLCLLSHGYEGGIIASDEAQISLKSIEIAFCCVELKNVQKIIIIQACQGNVPGRPCDILTTDGLGDSVASNITVRENFCIFISTLEGFVSMRDKKQGSWFIQELCSILQQRRRITFFGCVGEVIAAVKSKRGLMDGKCVAQLPELRVCRLDADLELPQYKSIDL